MKTFSPTSAAPVTTAGAPGRRVGLPPIGAPGAGEVGPAGVAAVVTGAGVAGAGAGAVEDCAGAVQPATISAAHTATDSVVRALFIWTSLQVGGRRAV
jgi:hypothetical protein